jgi:hypothetical protein
MTMLYRHFSAIVAMVVIGGASASAQKATIEPTRDQTALRTALLAPLASSNLAMNSFGGTFNGSPVTMGLSWVSLTGPAEPVLMGLMTGSTIVLGTPQGIANGNYSVVVTIPWSNQAATLSFVRAGNIEVAQCSIQMQTSYAAGAPVQRCDSGTFAVSDGKLNLAIQIKNPNPSCATCVWQHQLTVSQVTLNLWR